MTLSRSAGRVVVAVAATGAVLGGALVAPGAASSSPSMQPRGATTGVWTQVGQGFAIGNDDTLSQVFQLTSRSQLPQLAGGSDTIYAAGSFTFSGTTPVNRVARLHNGQWVPLAGDTSGIAPGATLSVVNDTPSPGVYGLALGGDDSLYAGGQFLDSDTTLNNVAKWDGSDWVAMGAGLKLGPTAGQNVQDVVVGNDFIGGDDVDYADDTIYALGGFVGACTTLACTADVPARGIAQYSQATSSWSAMADGTMTPSSAAAFAGAYIDDTLYVGGTFSTIGGASALHIAQWSESSNTWLPMGAGLGIVGNSVYAMAVHPTTKDLYVGGDFNQAVGYPAGSAPGIIKWDYLDDTWYSVGAGLATGNVDDIAFSADGMTMWLGLDQGAVDSSNANSVAKLTSSSFTSAAATDIPGAWSSLVSGGVTGVDGPAPVNGVNQTFARTVLPVGNDSAIFGGNFHTAGTLSVGRVAKFSPPAPSPPPAPGPLVYPPGAPTGVSAQGTVGAVTVSWSAPSVTGSFPITNYRVVATPGGATCEATTLTCAVTNLTAGTAYTFQAQAYNAAGWGPLSAPSSPVSPLDPPPPPPPASITIEASKRITSGRGTEVSIAASTVSIAPGTAVVPWTRIGRGDWTASPKRIAVAGDGSVAWKRKFGANRNGNIIAVRFVAGQVESSVVTLRPIR